MMDPLPTPFDIVPIPIFPWAPPLWTWLAVILLSIVTYLTFRVRSSTKKIKNMPSSPIQLGLVELRGIISSKRTEKEKCELISRLLRRILSVTFTQPGDISFNEMSSAELLKATEKLPPQAKEVTELISNLETLSYSPNLSATDLTQLLEGLDTRLVRLEEGRASQLS